METIKLKSHSILLFTVTVAAVFYAALAKADGSRSAYSAGQTAPAFQGRTTDGKTIKFPEDYKGKIVLLDFWATWCAPCRRELPNVTSTYEQYHSKGFEIIGISLDRPREGPQLIQFTKE